MSLSRKALLSVRPAQQGRGQQDATLIQRIAKGDESAFKLFQDATNGLLFGLLLRILGNTQTAEDLLSELYEEIRQEARGFSKQNERPLTWLILITHRCAIERVCSGSRSNLSEMSRKIDGKPQAATLPDSFINITEQRRFVRAALEAIPPLQRRMIELTFFSGMTHLEIATNLGQSPEEMESGLQHAILQLFGFFRAMSFTWEPWTRTRIRSH